MLSLSVGPTLIDGFRFILEYNQTVLRDLTVCEIPTPAGPTRSMGLILRELIKGKRGRWSRSIGSVLMGDRVGEGKDGTHVRGLPSSTLYSG